MYIYLNAVIKFLTKLAAKKKQTEIISTWHSEETKQIEQLTSFFSSF